MRALTAGLATVPQGALSPLGLAAFRMGVLALVLPFFDLPFVAVSISAPLFAVVFVEVVTSGLLSRPRYFGLLSLAALFASTQIAAVAIRILAGDAVSLEAGQGLLLLRYCYWALLFAATAIVVDRQRLGEDATALVAAGLVALALVRLLEGVVSGGWGAGSARWLSQNDYGFAFSMFAPFVLWMVFRFDGLARLCGGYGGLVVLTAIVANGSRSSWVASGVGLSVFVALSFVRGSRLALTGAAAAVALITAAAWAYAPASWRDPVVARAESFADLESDKPYLTRQVLIAKGVSLFRENPLVGVGAGRFAQEWADLDLPPELRYQTQDFYNRRTPHNAYVKLLAEAGLLGFIPLVALLSWVLWGSFGGAMRGSWPAASWVAAVAASLCGTAVHLWTASALTGSAPWFVLGLGAAAALSRNDVRGFKLYRLLSLQFDH